MWKMDCKKFYFVIIVLLITLQGCCVLYFGSSFYKNVANHPRRLMSYNYLEKLPDNSDESNSNTVDSERPFGIKYALLFTPTTLCLKRPIKLVIFVMSVIDDVTTRNVIRNTWASVTKREDSDIHQFFLIGRPNSADFDWNSSLYSEVQLYNDIVMYNFSDTYKNLTLKTMLGLNHVLKYCSNAEYVMKTDSDVYVNIPAIQGLLSGSNLAVNKSYQIPKILRHGFKVKKTNDRFNKSSAMYGLMHTHVRPERNSHGLKAKWNIDRREYAEEFFPNYLNGLGYIFSMELVKEIVQVSESIPLFRFEDVYVGLCLQKLGYNVTNTDGFIRFRRQLTICSHKYLNVFAVHNVNRKKISAIWNKNCSEYGVIGFE